MVDALRQARQWIAPSGFIVDMHPTADVPIVWIGEDSAGPTDPGGATARHQNATNAIATVVADRLLTIEDWTEFEFSTYADSIDELQTFIAATWREASVPEQTMTRARQLLAVNPHARVCARERVIATRMRR